MGVPDIHLAHPPHHPPQGKNTVTLTALLSSLEGGGFRHNRHMEKKKANIFFLMPPMQNQPHARGNQSSFLLLAPEQGRSLDLLCLPQCPAPLTQINLSQHHRDAAQEPQGKVCQQEMPQLGVSCDPPSLPSLLCSSFCLVLTPVQLWWDLVHDLTGKGRQMPLNHSLQASGWRIGSHSPWDSSGENTISQAF